MIYSLLNTLNNLFPTYVDYST
ncbi:MAG: DUF1563 domain-containing protein [Lachnospiraceae bacterium]|nr:DUF1563 domain-containing protein [Lachnospiraceae bacterium]MBR1651334.1 DUF1563 domain-containing protein [Lachnospiraceae bacterium]MBR4276811.1 DUF1563 domain-containing protein [Lachnospiraceae bacterium]MBR6303618.1 DUF1563 domain-containing protein [Lachnospiraceae bacterium]MBR6909132.1 DUF1563 domain-containing protein [Lachnospiraceae bacterium]